MKKSRVKMDNKELVKALRDDFAPRVREMCAADDFDCDHLCAVNIITSQCVVFQAADALERFEAENAALRARSTCKGCIYFGEFGEDEDVPCNECSRVIRGTDHYRRKPVTADEQEGIT